MRRGLYLCGCQKVVAGFRFSPEYRGIMSVHADGSDCSSEFEGEYETEAQARRQIQVSTAHYIRLRAKVQADELRRKAAEIEAKAERAIAKAEGK